MRLDSALHLLSHRALPNHCHYRRVLHHCHVRGDMCIMVLIYEGFGRFAHKERHVLADWVFRRLVILNRNKLLGVLDAQHLQHLPVKLGKVIYLRCPLSQLDGCLVLHDPLRHSGSVRVTDWNHFRRVVVGLLGLAVTCLRCVAVIFRGKVPNDPAQQLELHPHRRMNPCLNSTHGLQRALKQR